MYADSSISRERRYSNRRIKFFPALVERILASMQSISYQE